MLLVGAFGGHRPLAAGPVVSAESLRALGKVAAQLLSRRTCVGTRGRCLICALNRSQERVSMPCRAKPDLAFFQRREGPEATPLLEYALPRSFAERALYFFRVYLIISSSALD